MFKTRFQFMKYNFIFLWAVFYSTIWTSADYLHEVDHLDSAVMVTIITERVAHPKAVKRRALGAAIQAFDSKTKVNLSKFAYGLLKKYIFAQIWDGPKGQRRFTKDQGFILVILKPEKVRVYVTIAFKTYHSLGIASENGGTLENCARSTWPCFLLIFYYLVLMPNERFKILLLKINYFVDFLDRIILTIS